ncbi:MAG: dihydroorotase [Rhodothermales bacterium]|nr:dihydroorotase [Rhodothermales bacterium]
MLKTSNVLFKGGQVLDPVAGTITVADVLVQDGVISRVESDIEAPGVDIVDCNGKMISPGWMDMHVHFREPGQEHKETIATGCAAAMAGGFTAVACMPNTDPPIHTRDVVEFIIERGEKTPVDVHPIACVSREREGKELTEMSDLTEGGAVAFSDDGDPVYDAGLMRRALEYSSMLGKPIINHMEDLSLNPHGHMHEGVVSTRLGVPGIPGLAEEVMIARDILISEFTGGHVHVAHISTGRAVDLVRDAKARGINVTAEVCTHHFTLTDQAVEDSSYSTAVKMHPPLRTDADILAIKEGLRDGTIQAICTDHAPHASFEKEVEFIAAPFGIIGLETAWGLIGRELIRPGVLSVIDAVRLLTTGPRDILGMPNPAIASGSPANLTIFDATTEWTFTEADIKSKSHNTPFIGSTMVGRPFGIYNREMLWLRESVTAAA